MRYLLIVVHRTIHRAFGETTILPLCLDIALLSFVVTKAIKVVSRFIFLNKSSHV